MSIIDNIKNFFNIGGVKITLDTPVNFSKASRLIEGSYIITSKSLKHIEYIKIELIEVFQSGRGTDKTVTEYVWGKLEIPKNKEIREGDVVTEKFLLNFIPVTSSTEKLAQNNGVLGGIGKMAMFADGSKSTFKVKALVFVKGTVIGPSDEKTIKQTE